MIELKDWYAVQELAGLPGMAGTVQNVRNWAKKNLPTTRLKARGKGFEYAFSSLPIETQQHLQHLAGEAVAAAVIEKEELTPAQKRRIQAKALPAVRSGATLEVPDSIAAAMIDGSTEAQRDQARAISLICVQIKRLEDSGAQSTRAACQMFITQAKAGLLLPGIRGLIDMALDKRGRKGQDDLPSLATLQGWMKKYEEGRSLIPKLPKKALVVEAWMPAAAALHARPQKPTMRDTHAKLVASWNRSWGWPPVSYDRTYRFLSKELSTNDLLKGQHKGSALAAKLAYRKRSSAGLDPFIECHADGWTTHFTAPHPLTGEFVSYEVWHFHELSTRYVTKPSVGFTENTQVILAGLKNYVAELGVPAVWQTDHTRSVKNKVVKNDPLTSVTERLGTTVVHPATPGNSQANGIAENFNTYLDRASRELATYQHPDRMDSLTHRNVKRLTTKMMKAAMQGETPEATRLKLVAENTGKGRVFTSHAEAVAWIEAAIDKFNNTPHSALAWVVDEETGQRRRQTPREAKDMAIASGFERVMLSQEEMLDAFAIHVTRKVTRGMVQAFSTASGPQVYRDSSLDHIEGQTVVVAWDMMDGSKVWVKDTSGNLLCTAALVETTGYRALSFYEASQEKRADQQLKRLDKKANAIAQRMAPVFDASQGLPPPSANVIDMPTLVIPTRQPEPDPVGLPKGMDLATYLYGDAADAPAQDLQQAYTPPEKENHEPEPDPTLDAQEDPALFFSRLMGYEDEKKGLDAENDQTRSA
jgi:putative transposase